MLEVSGDQYRVSDAVPKAEMHVHVSLAHYDDAFLRRIKKGRTTIKPDFLLARDERYYKNLTHFHKTYEEMRHLTSTHQELSFVVQSYLERIARHGAIFAELSFSFRDKKSFNGQLEAVVEGVEKANYNTGIEARIVVTSLRNHGYEHAVETVKFLEKNPNPYVTAFGLVGDEGVDSISEYKYSMEYAWGIGLGLVPHVGEQYLQNAIDFLDVFPREALVPKEDATQRMRVGHGTTIYMSDAVLQEFVQYGIFLEECLSANIRIGVPKITSGHKVGDTLTSAFGKVVRIDRPILNYFDNIYKHPIILFSEQGIPFGLGADNPLLMNTNIGKEYSLAKKSGLNDKKILDITRASLKFANIDYFTRQRIFKLVDHYEAKLLNNEKITKTPLGYRF